jgi:hypothetical protein
MNTPKFDLVIETWPDGRLKRVLSTLPITYALAVESALSEPHKEDFLGTNQQVLFELGLRQPSREFDASFVMTLVQSNKLLRNAFEKYGYTCSPEIVANAKAGGLNGNAVKILKTLYNAFILADKDLEAQYLKIQSK